MNKVPCGIYGHAYIYWWNHLGMLLLCWGGRNCGSEVNNEQSEFGASNPRWKHHGTQLAHWCANTMIFYMWMEQHGIDRSGKTVVWSNVTGTTGWWTMELTNLVDISLIQIWVSGSALMIETPTRFFSFLSPLLPWKWERKMFCNKWGTVFSTIDSFVYY